MSRWEPNARGRLELAALELYSERGFDQTTVAEIAGRAGLTERTFFRHFADKREVLFYGAAALQDWLVSGIDEAPAELSPMDAIGAALTTAAGPIGERGELAWRRQAIVAATPELQERELIKLAALAGAIADALRRRGVREPASSLAAEAGVAVFKIAFQRWTAGAGGQSLAEFIKQSMAELRTVTADTALPACPALPVRVSPGQGLRWRVTGG
jgi:AcrR family transcriptional regulator